MASEPVNGEGIGGAREKQGFRVYTRKGKGLRKQTVGVAVGASDATDRREKPEENVTATSTPVAINDEEGEDVEQNDDVVPPVALVQEGVGPIGVHKSYVEGAAAGTVSVEDVRPSVSKTSTEAPSENLVEGDADAVAEKTSVEALSEAHVEDDASLAVVDINTAQPSPAPAAQDDVSPVVEKKSVELPSQTLSQEEANTVVIDNNSIKEALENEGQDFNTVVVDKNPIEASSQTLSHEDAKAVVVDKNSIEVPSEEDVNVVDADNTITEAPSKILAEHDAKDGSQQAEIPSDSVPMPIPSQVTALSTEVDVTENIPMEEGPDGRIRIHMASSSRKQKKEIRRKLEHQLNLVRGVVRRIEDREGEIVACNDFRASLNTGINNGGDMVLPGFASAGHPREIVRPSRPLNQLSISVFENTHGANEHVEKEKRTPKANQFYRNSEFLLAKDKFPPADSNKKPKSSAKKHGGEVGHGFGPGSKIFKNCSALLERLMKHKHGWVFNAPVDVKGLGLHDYFTIIKHPMDLGTIKSRLTKNWYKSPREFAEDVRLTFFNAMTYNPKGQDVHIMAEQLLKIFEERWAVIESDYSREMRFLTDYEMNLQTPRSRLAPTLPPPSINVRSMMDRPDWSSRPVDLQPKPASTTPSGRTPALKKPKANEPNKRDMTYEEKQKLSANLQNLPPEKLDPIVQIVNKRNTAVKLRDEEIEVDIDSVDPETLWELDRFVTNYKKSLSKKKRKAELAFQARAEAERKAQQMTAAPMAEDKPRESSTAQKSIPTYQSSQAEKPNHEASRSSSSSSSSDSSSSSSDSDSDSSSSSGSDQT